MAGKQLDIMHPREYTNRDGQAGTHWLKCGVAFLTEDQNGNPRVDLRMWLQAPSTDGESRYVCMEPKEPHGRFQGPGGQQQSPSPRVAQGQPQGGQGGSAYRRGTAPQGGHKAPDPDDNIPF